MVVEQRTEIELVEFKDGELTLKMSVAQTADEQEVVQPGAAAGTKTTLKSLNSTGTSTMHTRLDSLTPLSMTAENTTDVTMEVTMGDQAQAMSMQMKMKIAMSPGEAARATEATGAGEAP
jgi:hypothetical protein